jgi:CMP-N-acetylneuraminic acid synthetase
MSKPDQKVVAIIPARGDSEDAAESRTIRPLAGKPLLAYAIDAAKSSPLIDRVIVSTNSEEIARVAKEWGAEVPFRRPADISGETATTESALQHAVLWLDKHEDYHADIVVYLTCTSVFRQNCWVNEVVKRLLEDESLDSVFIVQSVQKNFWRRLDGNWVRLAPDIVYASRQTREPLYREETPVACATRGDVIRQGRRVGPHVDLIITDDTRVTINIQSEFDFWLAEKIMAEWPMERPLE